VSLDLAWGVQNWMSADLWLSLRQTLILGVGGALLTTVCVIPIAWLGIRYPHHVFRMLEGCIYITSSLPGIVTALALVTVTIHYARPIYQTEVTLFLAYLLMFMPRALINLRAGIAQAPVELENVARSLGSSPAKALWSVTMRLAAPVRRQVLRWCSLASVTNSPRRCCSRRWGHARFQPASGR
jgi:iron(III) transport system permease protein